MKRRKGNISITVIICFLLGMFPQVGSAKITPKEEKEKEYESVIIKKGDTLWDISGQYYGKPYQWPKFEDYNLFTNPHLIYPGEKLLITEKGIKVLPEYELKEQEIKETTVEIVEEVDLKDLEQIIAAKKKEAEELTLRIESLKSEESKLGGSMSDLDRKAAEKRVQLAEQEKALKELAKKREAESKQKVEGLEEIKAEKEEVSKFNQFLIFGIAAGIVLVGSLSK